jgi:hypothetical protein
MSHIENKILQGKVWQKTKHIRTKLWQPNIGLTKYDWEPNTPEVMHRLLDPSSSSSTNIINTQVLKSAWMLINTSSTRLWTIRSIWIDSIRTCPTEAVPTNKHLVRSRGKHPSEAVLFYTTHKMCTEQYLGNNGYCLIPIVGRQIKIAYPCM